MNFIKIILEVLNMSEQLSDRRFDVVMRLFWGGVIVAGCFAVAALIAAIRWW